MSWIRNTAFRFQPFSVSFSNGILLFGEYMDPVWLQADKNREIGGQNQSNVFV
jgi:hypothetical protein